MGHERQAEGKGMNNEENKCEKNKLRKKKKRDGN